MTVNRSPVLYRDLEVEKSGWATYLTREGMRITT